MAYTKINWQNGVTPLNATNLNKMDQGIYDAHQLINLIYPVGCYFETTDENFDPQTTFGGTWVLETPGQVHVSAGTGYEVAGGLTNTSDGGESTVTLDVTQMPSHTHVQNAHNHGQDAHQHGLREQSNSVASGSSHGRPRTDSQTSLGYGYWTSAAQPGIWYATATNQNTGGGQPHNNMQPYINVYRWHRTA